MTERELLADCLRRLDGLGAAFLGAIVVSLVASAQSTFIGAPRKVREPERQSLIQR